MIKDCWTCKHFIYDRSCDAADCKKAGELTEAQYDTHFADGKPNCPCWAQIEEYTEGLYE